MDKLIIFNLVLIAIIAGIIYVQKYVKTEKTRNIILVCVSLLTIIVHYSSLLYHYFLDRTHMDYLRNNPNLVLPIYPCNVVMWCAIIFALCKNKESKLCKFLADYLFWFGIFSTLVGMFANVDFIREPTLKNYDVTKGIVSHATLLLNVLLIPRYGYIKINFGRNMLNIVISVVMMLIVGLYCNLVFTVIGSSDLAYDVNSMFLIHSPFEGVQFLTYPFIATIAIVLYFIIFTICELFVYKKGERWFNKIKFFKNKELEEKI